MHKRLFCMCACIVLLCVLVTGCGGVGGGIDEVFCTVDGVATVVISPGYAWPDKPDADKTTLAKQGVDAAIEAYAKQQNDKEYGDLYELELHTVVGRFNGQTVFYYNANTVPEVTIDQSTIVANIPSTDAVQSVSDILLFGIENGDAYFNAFLSPTVDWNTSDDQERIIENIMAYCETYADNEGAISFEVICFTDEMQTAFVYKGGDTVQVHLIGSDQVRDYVISD